jgi:hypothetical protein
MGHMGGLLKGSLGGQGMPSDTGRLVVVSSLLPEHTTDIELPDIGGTQKPHTC